MSASAPGIISFPDALAIVLREAATLFASEAEPVGLLASSGRILAEPITADRDQPPFDRSTRDGFAVRAAEWYAGKKLRVIGQVRAGEKWAGPDIADGEAVEIMTGAPLPAGADAVAMVEHAEQDGNEVSAVSGRALRVRENIVPRGSEARAGQTLLQPGISIGAGEIALASACGSAEVRVYKRPRVNILATGDELVEIAETPEPHQIRNSNSYALAALVSDCGGEAQRLPIADDTREDLRARIEESLSTDLLLLSGGVSAGKYDLVEDVLAEFGAEFFFTGVKMQPGKPAVFGRIPRGSGWLYFFGLPGNPVSTEVAFRCFAATFLRALSGASADSLSPNFAQATLAEDISAKPGLTRLLPARLAQNFSKPEVRLVPWQGSGDLAANARANCYAVLPNGCDLHAGDVITVLLR